MSVAAILLAALRCFAADGPPGLKSGLQPGDRVPSFYVRAVTGPLRNKSVCYVCRNGERPVVMVLIRDVTPELRKLLKEIDGILDAHRAEGLRGFGVFTGRDGKELLPAIQTLGFEEKLNLPLTISAASGDGAAAHALHPEAVVTVILYREQKVTANFAWRAGELTEGEIDRVRTALRALAAAE